MGDVFIASLSHCPAQGAAQQSRGCQPSGWDTGSPSSPTQWQLSAAHHVPALLDLGAALVLFLDTLGHGFSLGCFLSPREEKPEHCPSSACCPHAVRVSISSPSSPGLDTHPGEASTACPDLCPMWKQRQKFCIDLFSPFGIIFSKCTSPLLPLGPVKAGRQGSSPFSSPLLNLLPREQQPQISMEPGSHPPLVCATPVMPLAAVPSPAP